MRAKRSNLFHGKEIASSLRLLAMTGGTNDSVLPEVIEKLLEKVLFSNGRSARRVSYVTLLKK